MIVRTLKECIIESLLDNEDKVFDGAKKGIVEEFLKENYNIHGSYTIKETKTMFIVDVKGDIEVANESITSLTNGLFEFGEVSRDFNCPYCDALKTLKGAPEKVGESFSCHDCKSLTSLEGAPKEVKGSFDCSECKSLKSLEGAPEKVDRYFDCSGCKSLKSLQGAPEKIGWAFDCSGCKSLKSLKGAPKEVGDSFYCSGCGTKFTEEDVRKYTNVKVDIWM